MLLTSSLPMIGVSTNEKTREATKKPTMNFGILNQISQGLGIAALGDLSTLTGTTASAPAGGGGLSGGAIAGIGVGAFVAGGFISYFITRRRRVD